MYIRILCNFDLEILTDISIPVFKLQVQYPQSKCCRLSLVRDLPPVSGSIIWAKQIDHQLTTYLKRVEDVLGIIFFILLCEAIIILFNFLFVYSFP